MTTIGEPVTLARSEREQVRVAIEEFRGRYGIDIRIFFVTESGDWRPTKRGIRIPVEQKDELVAAIEKVSEQDLEIGKDKE